MRAASSETIPARTDVSPASDASRACASLGRLVGEAAGRFLADVEHGAVAVEQVVDELEQRPELGRERAPGRLLGRRHLGRVEAAHDRRLEQRAGLQAVDVLEVALRPRDRAAGRRSSPSVAATSSRATAGDRIARARGAAPRRAARRRPGSPSPRRARPRSKARPRRSASSSRAGRSSWTSENVCTSSTAAAAGSSVSTRGADRVTGREAEHRAGSACRRPPAHSASSRRASRAPVSATSSSR